MPDPEPRSEAVRARVPIVFRLASTLLVVLGVVLLVAADQLFLGVLMILLGVLAAALGLRRMVDGARGKR